MIKAIAKKILPNVIQSKIRSYIMIKHKENIEKQESLNKKEQYLKDFFIIKERESIFKMLNYELNSNQKNLVSQISKEGLFFGKLSDFYYQNDELLKYLEDMAYTTKGKSYKELEEEHISKDFKHAYGRQAHFLNLYHPKKDIDDPIKKFVTDPKIFTMAARYLGEIPQVMMLSFLYTPKNTLDERGPMLWHLDRHHDSVFRMFINPFEMSVENGATMAFPSKYTEEEFYQTYPYFNNDEANINGFNFDDIVTLEGEAGMFGVVDTCKNFHCGSRSKEERFLAILTFVPYIHKNRYDASNILEERDTYENENQIIYDYFKNNSI